MRGTECGEIDGRLPYLPKPGEPTDSLGRPLPADLYRLVNPTEKLTHHITLLDIIAGQLKAMRSDDALRHLDIAQILRAIGQLRRPLSRCRPKCVCPSCNGIRELKRHVACRTCDGAGWISEGNYDALNHTLRSIAEGFRDPDQS